MLPERETHLHTDWIGFWANVAPTRVGIVDAISGREFTYKEMRLISERVAIRLREDWQIGPGDRVAVLATNEVEYFFLFFAIQRLGAIMVPINFRLTAREVAHVLSDSDPQLFVLQTEFEGLLPQLPPGLRLWSFNGPGGFKETVYQQGESSQVPTRADFEAPCMILYTSGTTGAPKGALITHKMLFWNSVATSQRLNLSQEDVCLSFLPFFHTGGWNVLNTPFLHRGAKIVFIPKFEPDLILELCGRYRVSILFGVPTMMEMLRQSPLFESCDLTSVRYAIVGGEPMPLPLINTWVARGIPVRQGFGMTEFGPNIFSLNEEHCVEKIGSIGFPNSYVDVRVVDDLGEDVTPGEVGELWLRGPACTPGYWRNPDATRKSLRDGWFASGDLVRCDEDGFFFVVGRKKDMFISGGENVYPTEVEQVLRSHPQVRDVAVVGVPHPKWGEVGRAFVVPQSEGTPSIQEELARFCRDRLAKFKIPQHFTFLEELPKGDSGKVLKKALREVPL